MNVKAVAHIVCTLLQTTSRKSKTITSTLSSITRTLSQIKDISRTYNYLPWIICLDIFFLNQDYLLSYTSSGWHFKGFINIGSSTWEELRWWWILINGGWLQGDSYILCFQVVLLWAKLSSLSDGLCHV